MQRHHCCRWLLLFATILLQYSADGQVSPVTESKGRRLESLAEVGIGNVPKLVVASIRQSKRGGMSTVMFTADGFYFARVPMQMVIQRAFGVDDNRIVGLPGWARSDSCDIQAKVDDADLSRWREIPKDQRRIALIPLLAGRFSMQFHHETKVLPALNLTVYKKGPKLKIASPGDLYANGVQGPDGPRGGGSIWSEPGKITGQGVPIGDLVALLSFQSRLGYQVVDRTGLVGKYDFVLSWKEDPLLTGIAAVANSSDADSSGTSIFTALREELGLNLKVQKLPADVIVIDRIEKPSEN